MTKIQMTEPICYANVVDIESYKESPRVNRRIPGAYDVPLYTKDQAEAYKDACVREELEEAAQACEARIGTGDPGVDTSDCDEEAQECAAAIRALIPTTK